MLKAGRCKAESRVCSGQLASLLTVAVAHQAVAVVASPPKIGELQPESVAYYYHGRYYAYHYHGHYCHHRGWYRGHWRYY